MNRFFGWFRQPQQAQSRMADAALRSSGVDTLKGFSSPLVALHASGEASWSSSAYENLAREGYARNPVVHRCIRMICEAAASMPWLLYEGRVELDDHPLIALLDRPNAFQSGPAFMEALHGSLLVSGNAYLLRTGPGAEPRELHLLRADQVTLVHDDKGWPTACDHSVNGQRTRYPVTGEDAPLLAVSLFNPLSPHEGLPPLGSAHMALDIHNAASRWNKALLDNSARPSGALVYAPGDGTQLTVEQFERLRGELDDGHGGARRAGRPMLLEGGLDWKPMGLSPRDMDFIEARNAAARDIALAFGVPPMLLGIPGDNTYSNYQEANRVFWRQTVLPMVNRVAGALGHWLAPAWGGNLRLDVDRDQVEALSVDREALWKRVNEAGFLTVNEKRAATGYGELGDDEAL